MSNTQSDPQVRMDFFSSITCANPKDVSPSLWWQLFDPKKLPSLAKGLVPVKHEVQSCVAIFMSDMASIHASLSQHQHTTLL